jgi:small multidrug resistance pump
VNPWLILGLAIVAEIIATSFLRASDGLTRLGPALVVVAGYSTAIYLLSLSLRDIPVGVAYAVWSGVGIMLIALVGWVVLDQRLDAAAVIGMALIVAGVIVINVFSTTTVVG